MRAWRKYHNPKRNRKYWQMVLAQKKFLDHTLLYILAKGSKVRFRWNCNAPLRKAMKLVNRDVRGGETQWLKLR